MATNVVGLFDTHEQADNAVRELLAEGITPGRIGVVAADPGGTIQRRIIEDTGDMATAGAATGAASGIIVGGMIGLFIGAVTMAVPPVGFILAGPIAGMLAGAGVGLVSGGVLGAMIGLGIPEAEAHIYAEGVRRGSTVLTVEASDLERGSIEDILGACGAVDVADRGARYRREGFAAFDPAAPLYSSDEVIAERARLGLVPLTTLPTQDIVVPTVADTEIDEYAAGKHGFDEEEMVPIGLDEVFGQHFMVSERELTDLSYEQYRPAYRYGYEVAERPEYRNKPWPEVQPAVQEAWEDLNPGTWPQFASAIHFGWNCLAPRVPAGVPRRPSESAGISSAKVL